MLDSDEGVRSDWRIMTFEERYARNRGAISAEECAILEKKRVGVIGCGGLGGYIVEMLARVGVGHLMLVDRDVFEASNLNRQILCTMAALGRPKVDVARARVAEVNPFVEVEARCIALDGGNADAIIAGCDCVVDALDSLDARRVLAAACAREAIPLVTGGIAGWNGQVGVIWPGDGSADILFPPDAADEERAARKRAGSLSFTPACIASFQAAETVKVLLGRTDTLQGRVLFVDLAAGSVQDVKLW